jgi:hypothetical protein
MPAASASSSSAPGRIIDLSHIKKPLPVAGVGVVPPPIRDRAAWPGGAIVSNAAEATVRFLRRRLASGAELTEPQKAFLDAHRELVLAEPLPAAPTASAPAPPAAGSKRKRGSEPAPAPAPARPPAPVQAALSSRLDLSLDALIRGGGKAPKVGRGGRR